MIRSKMLAAAAVIGLLAAVPVAAQGMGPGHPMGHPMGMHGGGSPFMMLINQANLTPEQRSQVDLILQSNKAKMEAIHQQLQSLHERIADKMFAPGSLTASDLKPLVQQASELEAKVNQNMADTAVAIRNVLNAQQIAKLAQMHAKLHTLHSQIQKLMGPGEGGPDDPPN